MNANVSARAFAHWAFQSTTRQTLSRYWREVARVSKIREESLRYADEHFGQNRPHGVCEFCFKPGPEDDTLPSDWAMELGCPICPECVADARAKGMDLVTEYRGDGRSYGADPRLVRELVREVYRLRAMNDQAEAEIERLRGC